MLCIPLVIHILATVKFIGKYVQIPIVTAKAILVPIHMLLIRMEQTIVAFVNEQEQQQEI